MRRFRSAALILVATCLAGCQMADFPVRAEVTTVPPRRAHIPKVNTTEPSKSSPYWKKAFKEVYKSPQEIEAQIEEDRKLGKILPMVRHGRADKQSLAITFDDGPHPGYTLRLLEILKKRNVKATFFLVGKQAEKYPALVKAIQRDGHEIGNHTFSHVDLTRLSVQEVETEYRACNDVLESITGVKPSLCRPPGGNYAEDVINAALANQLTTVFWTNDPGDYARPDAKVLAERAIRNLHNGSILLFHGGIEETLDCLPTLFDFAQKNDFKWETVSGVIQTPSP